MGPIIGSKSIMTTEIKNEAVAEVVEPKTIKSHKEPSPRVISNIAVDALNIEHSYQRPATKKMEAIGKNWNDNLVGYPVVSLREDNSYWIIDGQHRIGGARIAGKSHIACDVRTGLSLLEEARLFDELNGQRSQVTAVDRYKAKMFYNDPEALEVTNIVQSYGGEITVKLNDTSKRAIRSVSQLFRIYEQEGGERLKEVLAIINEAWGAIDYDTTNELTLAGINQFLSRKAGKHDRARLVSRLNTEGVTQIKRMAHAHSQIFGGSGPVNFYRAMVEAYNRNMPQRQRIKP